jgi:hypothetical protein
MGSTSLRPFSLTKETEMNKDTSSDLNKTQFVFSIAQMERCNGNGRDDLQYTEFFCSTAIARAKAASERLTAIADLSVWSENVREECDSLRGLLEALHATVNRFIEFFAQNPEILRPLSRSLAELATYRQKAVASHECICTWFYY